MNSFKTKAGALPTIFFVRHGEIPANTKNLLPGWKNEELNETGLGEAREVAKTLKDEGISHIYSSPLKRTRKVAEEIKKMTGAGVTSTNSLGPWDYGEFTGKPSDAKTLEKLKSFQKDSKKATPKGESFEKYLTRFKAGTDKMREYVMSNPSNRLVAVTHSRNLLALKRVLGSGSEPIPTDKSVIPEAAIWKAEFDEKGKAKITHVPSRRKK